MYLNTSHSLIYESNNSQIYYLPESEYGKPVVIKVLKTDSPSSRQLMHFRNEFEITKDITVNGARKSLALTGIDNKLSLIMEYIPGKTLKQTISEAKLSVIESLVSAVRIAEILSGLHDNHIIHRNISSTNILIDPGTREITLIDFSLASRFNLQMEYSCHPDNLPGNLSYISPEQTGRMNRIVDYSTDFYSLGVVIYEMLTGALPFNTNDPMKLIHFHMARIPQALTYLNSMIPPLVSDIVLKLLSKNAEDRYKSASGLKCDLERCLNYLQSPEGSMNPKGLFFNLAMYDSTDKFQIPQKLYGMASENSQLLAAFMDSEPFDLLSVVKASQAIAGEIEPERMLRQMMRIVIENVGAQRGALVLERSGEWVIEALGDVDKSNLEVLMSRNVMDSEAISSEILSHVVRTRETVVLDNASVSGNFVNDPYIIKYKVKSVICIPLVTQARIAGIVYLENNRASSAFTSGRLELIKILSIQMALSLDNARLNQQAHMEIAERRIAEEGLRECEQRFQTIFNSVNEAIFVHDISTGKILDVNSTMCSMYGYTREEALKLNVGDLSSDEPPYTRTEALERIQKAVDGTIQVFQWRAKDKGGRLFWVEVNMMRTYINCKLWMLVTVRDISERKQTEDALHESERKLIEIQKMVQLGYWTWDVKTGNVEWSEEVFKIFHLDPKEFTPRIDSILELSPWPEDHERDRELIRKTMESHEKGTYEQRFLLPDKSVGYYQSTFQGKYDDTGNLVTIVGTVLDITERKRAEEEVRRLNEELEQRVFQRTAQLEAANKELNDFSYSVSHDLRTPLRAINGYTNILQESCLPNLDEEGKRVCNIITGETQRMGRLIDDLLAFLRLGRTEMRPSMIEMETLVNSVFQKLTHKKVSGQIDFHVGSLPQARGDLALLRLVWTNLISNAIKFSSQRERSVIEVSGWSEAGENIYKIQDNGTGFDMRYAKKLFIMFQRLHSEKEFDGTGVGLAIVQRAVKRHGGRVWAESRLDNGSEFYFALPG